MQGAELGSRRRSYAAKVSPDNKVGPLMKLPEMQPSQILFLPGALGRTQLWEPVENLLTCSVNKEHVGWPGFCSIPLDPLVNGIDDLVKMVLAKIDRPIWCWLPHLAGLMSRHLAAKIGAPRFSIPTRCSLGGFLPTKRTCRQSYRQYASPRSYFGVIPIPSAPFPSESILPRFYRARACTLLKLEITISPKLTLLKLRH